MGRLEGRAIELFAELCDLGPERQAERLEEIGKKDPALRADIEELLEGDLLSDGRLDEKVAVPASLVGVDRGQDAARETLAVVERLISRTRPFEHYRIEGEVGRGGMGKVLEVWDEDLERPLAMKVIVEEGSASDAHATTRFLDEARVTGQLDHPGIVPVHELGLDAEGRVYFTMKLVRGRTLHEIFDLVATGAEGWSQTRALGVLLKVCEAMAYAHSRDVVHRDLKPANVMVGRFGEVYVMDWGVARVRGKPDEHDLRPRPGTSAPNDTHALALDSPVVTVDGTVVGTPYYMPPEQAAGQLGGIDARSDVYALGAMLYHLLAGRPPYAEAGRALAPHVVLARVLQGAPPSVQALAREAPVEVSAICEKAMARQPADRYADTSALSDDLRAFLEGRVVHAHETGAWAEARKWVKRNKALAAACGAALVVLILGLAVSLFLKAQSERNAALAEINAEAATKRADEVLRLSALQDLEDLLARAGGLWPAHPENIAAYEKWIDDARKLVADLPLYRKITFLPEDPKARWWNKQLTKLIEGLEELELGLLAEDHTTPEHGWSIPKRLLFAAGIESSSVHGPEAAARWANAVASIRDRAQCPQYDGLEMSPQLGLLPIGRDQVSGLWEFAHLATGKAAERGADGKLALSEETGLVFVLLPGDKFRMGTQESDPNGLNYDPQTEADERPVHTLILSSFFLSKYEMTQGQWLRFTGRNPSSYGPGSKFGGKTTTLLNPVEQVSWTTCSETLGLLGLDLPTEAQWEYATRAGTTSAWWTGNEKVSLEGAANLADSASQRSGGSPGFVYEDWLDDGHAAHAPVGSYESNAFGLHDVAGNVWEWCRDWYNDYGSQVREGDGAREGKNSLARVSRGGSFYNSAVFARSAHRFNDLPGFADGSLGVRPARGIEP